MTIIKEGLLENPLGEIESREVGLAPRLDDLKGKRGLFLSNGQQNADELLVKVEELLSQRYELASAVRRRSCAGQGEQKREEIPPSDFVIGGIGL